MTKETKLFLVSIITYAEPETDAKKYDYQDCAIFAKTYAEAEERVINFIGEEFIYEIGSIVKSDSIPVYD
jgi:hypothetical protein